MHVMHSKTRMVFAIRKLAVASWIPVQKAYPKAHNIPAQQILIMM
jgi:hypothetical protein